MTPTEPNEWQRDSAEDPNLVTPPNMDREDPMGVEQDDPDDPEEDLDDDDAEAEPDGAPVR